MPQLNQSNHLLNSDTEKQRSKSNDPISELKVKVFIRSQKNEEIKTKKPFSKK